MCVVWCFSLYCVRVFFFLMVRRPPRSTRTDTLFPDTTLCRSALALVHGQCKRSFVGGQTARMIAAQRRWVRAGGHACRGLEPDLETLPTAVVEIGRAHV